MTLDSSVLEDALDREAADVVAGIESVVVEGTGLVSGAVEAPDVVHAVELAWLLVELAGMDLGAWNR